MGLMIAVVWCIGSLERALRDNFKSSSSICQIRKAEQRTQNDTNLALPARSTVMALQNYASTESSLQIHHNHTDGCITALFHFHKLSGEVTQLVADMIARESENLQYCQP